MDTLPDSPTPVDQSNNTAVPDTTPIDQPVVPESEPPVVAGGDNAIPPVAPMSPSVVEQAPPPVVPLAQSTDTIPASSASPVAAMETKSSVTFSPSTVASSPAEAGDVPGGNLTWQQPVSPLPVATTAETVDTPVASQVEESTVSPSTPLLSKSLLLLIVVFGIMFGIVFALGYALGRSSV